MTLRDIPSPLDNGAPQQSPSRDTESRSRIGGGLVFPRLKQGAKRPLWPRMAIDALKRMVVVPVRIPAEQYRQLVRFAEANDTSISAVLRYAGARLLEQRER